MQNKPDIFGTKFWVSAEVILKKFTTSFHVSDLRKNQINGKAVTEDLVVKLTLTSFLSVEIVKQ